MSDAFSPLTGSTITSAAAAIAAGRLDPEELVAAHLARIEELNPTLNAFITVDREGALDAARRAARESGGPLRGIPIGIKDNIPVAGLPATQGCAAFADHVPARDNGVVARLRAAGAVIVGKTNMHECACGGTTDNPFYGPARNPWDIGRSPAGSSGGCAVAVSGDLLMASFGTDAGGSVRFPAAVTGLVGLRPTLGLLPTDGMLSFSTDTIGPLTRTVDDAELVFDALVGSPGLSVPSVRELAVATLAEVSWENTTTDVAAAVSAAHAAFAGAGAEVGEVGIGGFEHAVPAIDVLLAAETTAQHRERVRTRPEGYSAPVRQMIHAGEAIGAADYLQAQKYRRLLRTAVLEIMREWDALLLPSQPFTALPFGHEEAEIRPGEWVSRPYAMLRCSALAALTGLPAISVPVGVDAQGLPIGLQLVGRPHAEHTLFALARVIERRLRSPFATRLETATS